MRPIFKFYSSINEKKCQLTEQKIIWKHMVPDNPAASKKFGIGEGLLI